MRKYLSYMLALVLVFVPFASFADTPTATGTGIGGIQTTLPVYQLPELDPLEMPTLSKNYEDMASEMEDLGFGEYRFKKRLPLPDVEAPPGTGTNAYDIFVGTYGDLWSDPARQLNKESTLPVEEVMNAASSFSLQGQQAFDNVKSNDSSAMAALLTKKLDTSKNWDLSSIKASLPAMSSSQLNAYIAGVGKPAGWGQSAKAVSASNQFGTMSKLAANLGIDANGMVERSKMSGARKILTQGVVAVTGIDNNKAGKVIDAASQAAGVLIAPSRLTEIFVPTVLEGAKKLSIVKKADKMLDSVISDIKGEK